MHSVTMYTTGVCSYCKKAKEILESYAVVPTELRVDTDPTLLQEMRERTEKQTVPQIFIDNTHIGGFDELNALHANGTLSARLGLA